MSRLIRRKKEIGAALLVTLQLLTLGLIGLILPVANGPQQSDKAPADTKMNAPARQATSNTDALQNQAPTAQPLTTAEKIALRKSAHFAKKLQEPLASQVFNLAANRAAAVENTQRNQSPDSPNEEPTLTTDHEDYPPFSYVYINGTGFEPGETVNMIVVELDPTQESFEPWDVVADENGNISTSWYIFSEQFIGATLQVTATGETSGLSASAIFTDARNWKLHFAGTGNGSVTIVPSVGTVNAPPTCGGTGTNAASQTVTSECAPNITTSDNAAVIAFTVTANPGSTFGGWSSPSNWSSLTCTGTTNPCSGVAGSSAELTVTFNGGTPSPTPTPSPSPSPTPSPTPSPSPTPVTPTITWANPANIVYGTALSGTQLNATASVPGTFVYTPAAGTVLNAGMGQNLHVDFTPTDTVNYTNASANVTINVLKANATFTVTPYNVTYDGLSHTATVSTITGVNGETGATVGTVNVSATTHTNAGAYNGDAWTFTGGMNYNNQSGTVDDNIDKANATFTVIPYNVTYDGLSHTATVSTITGVNGETGATVGTVNVSATTHTNAGAYNGDGWTFTGGTNYNNQSGTVDDNIDKANATFTVTPYNAVFDSNPHTATVGTITGVNGETGATVGTVNVSATTHTNAGAYNGDAWTFTGGTNYNNQSGTVDDNIDKANATVVVTAYSVTYNGLSHTASYTVNGVGTDTSAAGSSIDVSGTTHTNAGTYNGDAWSFTGGNNYHNQNGTVDDVIDRANATVVVSPYTCPTTVYNGLPQTATVVSITGVNGETGATVGTVNVSNTTHTNAGTYATDFWFFTGTSNYNNIGNTAMTDCIAKADATVVVSAYTCPTTAYNGLGHTATYTISGVNGETGAIVGTINVAGTTHTNAGTYNNDPWSFTGGANYNDQSGTVNDCIAKADATVVVTAYTCPTTTYTGLPHTATYTISGVNGETGAVVGTINVTGTTHTNAGTYNNDPWSFTGSANYNNQSGTVNDCIAKANATFTVTGYNVVFDNNPHTATVSSINGVNGETGATVGTINLTGTTHTMPGDYPTDPWTFTGTANYNNQSDTVHDSIGTWTITGFYQPVDMNNVVNTVKGGSTVPLKFNIYAGGVEKTNVSDVMYQTCQVVEYSCINGTEDQIEEVVNTGSTNLRYDTTGHQFIQNWKTPNTKNKCYIVRMTALDGSVIQAYFKTK